MKKLITTALFLFVFLNLIKAQPYYFRHYQVEQGLSYNSVFSIVQDSKGFLWFGTKDGLNRFDGYSFKVFRSKPGDTTSLRNNVIRAIFEDAKKQLWVGTSNGLYCYNDTTQQFKLVPITINKGVWDMKSHGNGEICFIADRKLYKYNKSKGAFQEFSKHQDFEATATTFSKDGTLWVSSPDGLLRKYNKANDTFTSFNVFKDSAPVISHWIDKIYATESNSILIATSHQGVKLFDLATLSYKDILTFNKDKTSIYAKNFIHNEGDEYWVATESGVFVCNIKTGKYTNLRKNPNDPYAISDNAVYTFAKDKEGGIWVGTYFGGVNYYPKPFTFFDKFFPQNNKRSLSGNAIREICNDKYGNLWVGTEDVGVNKISSNGDFSAYIPDGSKTSIAHTNIHGLKAIGDELWIGTYEQGLDILDIKSGQVIRHYDKSNQPNALKSNFVDCIYQTRSGEILVGTSYGLHRYNKATRDFSLITQVPHDFHYTAITEDDNGTIWTATIGGGLLYFNAKTNRQGIYKNDPKNENSLSDNFVNGVFISANKMLWITTENGLNQFNPSDKTFKRYGTKDGFPSDVFYKTEEDKAGNLWISSSKGLISYNPASKKIRIYTTANGLLSDQFNYNSSFQDAAGQIYFGSVNGLVSFNPAKFKQNTIIPQVYITGFQVFNQELLINTEGSPLKKSISYTDKIKLKYDQSTFSIDFAALAYTDHETAEYAYKLEGVDKDFTYLKKNRRVFYTKLSPGNYTFLVKGANSSGVWNETPRKLIIEISPPFWLSGWAYFLYLILSIATVYALVLYTNNKIKLRNKRRIEQLENQKEKEIYEAKIEFFTQITHEIRTPLTLIKGPLETVIKKYAPAPEVLNYLLTMEKNADRLLHLTNQLLDFRKIESREYSLNLMKSNISEILREHYLRFKNAAEEKQIYFQLNLPQTEFYSNADEEALNKILSNLLSNAIKYSEKRVEVLLLNPEPNTNQYTITVKNDGFLIPQEMRERIFESFVRLKETSNQIGTGIGLALARSLSILHGGTLTFHADENDMNVFELNLPFYPSTPTFTEKPVQQEVITIPIQQEQDFETENITKEGRPLILLVDDNADILQFIAKELGDTYNCITASNGQVALDMLKDNAVQLIVSDVMMPVMDGYELCRQVKTNLDYSHIPLILLTAKSAFQSKIEGLEIGADAYIEKPFSPQHLQVQIQNLLFNRNQLKDYFVRSPLIHIKSIAHTKPDEILLEKLNDFIVKNIANRDLDVDKLAETLNMSRATFYRKIKSVSNLSPNELINITRLKKAAELLVETNYKIQQIADLTGFTSQSQLGRAFTKQFGVTPSEYANNFFRKNE
ncbi:hybrid sensor histidine kinase/response regulator [Pedobacter ginsengisoli]|uniref:histidine kinase n=1 Tax=Pedobacter ginsengisoli TaxID=363852 RepID=A0A2D1U4G1_9SPHI|nr:hybrid sensor histidine kinase/response regulator transcription factor [Pedobacter ginsengisoli]ATP56482.1 hybrid sensor histidine kinase/response regulator [Pedobacter ginsengisoli]